VPGAHRHALKGIAYPESGGSRRNEVDESLTSTHTPQHILAFRPSRAAQERLRALLDANQSRPPTPDEEAELLETLAVEQFMRSLKVKARAKARA
jgi:hypothetical protein